MATKSTAAKAKAKAAEQASDKEAEAAAAPVDGETPTKAKKATTTAKAPAKAKTATKAKAAAKPAKARKKAPAEDPEMPGVDEDEAFESDDEPANDAEGDGEGGGKKRKRGGALVVVESPAKAKTIKKYLGSGFVVKASVGHVKDLPKNNIGVDVEKDFQPAYVVIEGKKKVLSEIKAAARSAEKVLLAPDPDREGEAIAWHIADELRTANPNIQRVLFNEITKKAVTEAIGKPIELDLKKYESQQARRILDRLVGYQISPVLWNKVKRGLSAGRVQSVAVRLVVEREAEIKAFVPQEYWTIDVDVQGSVPPQFKARVARRDGAKLEMKNEGEAREVLALVQGNPLEVKSVERKERRKFAPPPFITSKLQQEASSKLRFSPKRTMGLAQRLYEGVELGEEGPVGLITYMRTDSTRVSEEALGNVRTYIVERYGQKSLPEQPNVFKTKKDAQDAHEAIRPTSMKYDPKTVEALFAEKPPGRDPKETEDLLKLYTLIWNRFVACQMVPAVFDQTTIDIEAGPIGLRASGQVMKLPGFLEVYSETVEDAANEDESTGNLPDVKEGERLELLATRPEQHFTQPPPRFSEATLVKELEEKGIGRPSTYATILSTIQDRGYVEKKEGRLHPTELGVMVNGLLVESFPAIVSSDFTAQLEAELDKVEEGQADWVKLLKDFYVPFQSDVEKAKVQMRDVKREETPTDINCEKCGSMMVIKWGRNGHFLACSGYPECKNTKEYERAADGTIRVVDTTRPTNEICPTCGAGMVIRRGRFGEFQACSKYPECKTTAPIRLGVDCPKEGCGGYLTEKRSRKGKSFYGCSNYSKTGCDFVLWDRPIPKPCPSCNAKFLVQKVNKSGMRLRCANPACTYAVEAEEAGEAAPAATTAPEGAASGSGTPPTAA